MIPVFLANLTCFVVGFLYPSYSTFKAVKSKNADHINQWAIYWICYSVYCLFEKFFDVFFSFWMPFYTEFKVMLIFMMTSNQASGSMLLYKTFIEHHLLDNEDKIDVCIMKVKEEGLKYIHFLYQHATVFMNKIKTQALVQLQVALASVIRDGLFSQLTAKINTPTDSVDGLNEENEQFTIIERSEGEFDVTQQNENGDEEEVTYMFRTEHKRGRGRPRKQK